MELNESTAETLSALAKRAGEAVMAHYTDDELEITRKGDDSPLTRADMASHRVILRGLAEVFPEIPVLSEESAATDWAVRKSWQRYFLVDPLDGTKEFIMRNGEFTVNIALIDEGEPVLGVVHAPSLGVTYVGMQGHGAWKEDAGGHRQTLVVAPWDRTAPLRVVGSRSHANPKIETFLSQLGSYEVVPMGSSLKLCMVAEGRADFYPRLGPTSEWDTAAAQGVVEAAGGYVVDRHGRAMVYNTKDSLLNDWFFVGTGSPDVITTLDIP